MRKLFLAVALVLPAVASPVRAAVGDPQVKTSHPWYPGELSCSTFDRLFKTQADLYKRVTGRLVDTDEDKALASWYWRNLHYAHGEEGSTDCFAAGHAKGEWNRDYWTGLFAHGFGLCGTTHAQYAAEMEALLGHCRARCVGVTGHNSFEVWLTGGAYGGGRWALLDHDISTVIFTPEGSRLMAIHEIMPQLKTLKDPKFKAERQRGWRVAGLHDDDPGVYDSFRSVEYLAGYAGPPPMVHLRRGETLRRYLKPGLDDGKTFVFWGRNYNTARIPGPERSRTWVNQPEKMYGSATGTGHHDGQARYANAVYTYEPDFTTDAYKEGVVEELDRQVTFEFRTPFVIGATPPNDEPWGVYDAGGKNGLVIYGSAKVPVALSTDGGKTWQNCGEPRDHLDLTDLVKGGNQYLLRFAAAPRTLAGKGLKWETVCQTNAATIPHLAEGENTITFLSSGRALVSAGPTRAQAEARVVAGRIDGNTVTLELKPPRGEKAVHVYAAGWVASGSPPSPDTRYFIDYSTDGGKTWLPVVKNWSIVRRPPEPNDFWSQSFCWGDLELPAPTAAPVRVRFRNDGGKTYRKVEAHLAYEVARPSETRVSFAWNEGGNALKIATHNYGAPFGAEDGSWKLTLGKGADMKWVEYAPR